MSSSKHSRIEGGFSSSKVKFNFEPLFPFVSDEAQEKIEKSYSKKNIIPRRKIHFPDFAELHIESLFDSMKWKEFLEINENYFPNLICMSCK